MIHQSEIDRIKRLVEIYGWELTQSRVSPRSKLFLHHDKLGTLLYQHGCTAARFFNTKTNTTCYLQYDENLEPAAAITDLVLEVEGGKSDGI